MTNLTTANQELFRRPPDECFDSLDVLHGHCRQQREQSSDIWQKPEDVRLSHDMTLMIGDNPDRVLNDWSFSQLCRMAGVSKDTINRLSNKTASRALEETLPRSDKPLQLLTMDNLVRSVHGVAYTRLWNADLLDAVREAGPGFQAPQNAMNGHGTGLYCGEQDMFAFLIDPLGWIEIDGDAFAPGFFVWNSEVGRRSLGVQTFWFQKVCQNHIVWDAVEVVEFSRKHTANVKDGLDEIRRLVEKLVARRDARRDSFAGVLQKALTQKLGDDAEQVSKVLAREDLPKGLIKEALALAQAQGAFTIFALVDAFTRLSQSVKFAGDRAELDQKIGRLFALAA
ncbi:DUF932 domain-containing protein [Planctomicrobium sp. SH664]|uniref:DUF932 domain-containing protein n=1 Tax=Planctomicrobium sp. SH664 TaxID=3448125 RepID=UPI003F5B0E8B